MTSAVREIEEVRELASMDSEKVIYGQLMNADIRCNRAAMEYEAATTEAARMIALAAWRQCHGKRQAALAVVHAREAMVVAQEAYRMMQR